MRIITPTWSAGKPTGKVRFSLGMFGRVVIDIQIEQSVVYCGQSPCLKRGDTRLAWKKADKHDTEYLIRLGIMVTDEDA